MIWPMIWTLIWPVIWTVIWTVICDDARGVTLPLRRAIDPPDADAGPEPDSHRPLPERPHRMRMWRDGCGLTTGPVARQTAPRAALPAWVSMRDSDVRIVPHTTREFRSGTNWNSSSCVPHATREACRVRAYLFVQRWNWRMHALSVTMPEFCGADWCTVAVRQPRGAVTSDSRRSLDPDPRSSPRLG